MTKISRRTFLKNSFFSIASFLVLPTFAMGRFRIDWNKFDISQTSNSKIKIIQLSDLHFKYLQLSHRYIARKINKLQPDLIFFTGDSVEETAKIEQFEQFMALIDVNIPKYAITGNWEYWGKVNLSKLTTAYQKYNCSLLINNWNTLSIKERNISIIGIDDFLGGHANFKESIKNLPSSDVNIVLSHCPAHRDIIIKEQPKELFIDLILSGHTHGGQINFLGYVPFKPQGSGSYLKGWYTQNEPKLYVSKGIGNSVVPFRIGARPEVVEIDI